MQIKKGRISDDGLSLIDGKTCVAGENLYLDGNYLGRFHSTKEGNYVLVLGGWPEYKKFAEAMNRKDVQLSLDKDTIIEVPFQDFENHYLSKLETVHADPISYIVREAEFPTGERVPANLVKEFKRAGKISRGNVILFPEKH